MITVYLYDVNIAEGLSIYIIQKWMKENLTGFYKYQPEMGLADNLGSGGLFISEFITYYVFEFELEEDAVAFKLKWI